ncbi:MAG: hypothetical protein Q8R57_05505 [Bacteroidota bacterium]|nr:hypothetical protein [Bacteroidota bacterium]
MKKFVGLGLLNLILMFVSSGFAQTLTLPIEIDLSNFEVYKLDNRYITCKSNNSIKYIQGNVKTGEIVRQFKYNSEFDKLFFEHYFKDSGSVFTNTNQFLNQVRANQKLVQFHNVYIDSLGEIYYFVEGKKIDSHASGNLDSAVLNSFCAIFTIGNDGKFKKFYPIYVSNFDSKYVLNFTGDFWVTGNDFYLSIRKNSIESKENYFISHWKYDGREILPIQIVPLELPFYHLQANLNYGLQRYILKEPYFMFYTCPTLYNLHNLTSKNIQGEMALLPDFSGLQKGNMFSINYTVCDFFIHNDNLKLITRFKNVFYLLEYDLKKNTLIKKKEFKDIGIRDLYRFPFFSEKGEVILVQKNPQQIKFLKKI